MKTYLIKNSKGEVVGFSKTLLNAKEALINNDKNGSITMMQGQYFGEGFHKYKLKVLDGKWRRVKL